MALSKNNQDITTDNNDPRTWKEGDKFIVAGRNPSYTHFFTLGETIIFKGIIEGCWGRFESLNGDLSQWVVTSDVRKISESESHKQGDSNMQQDNNSSQSIEWLIIEWKQAKENVINQKEYVQKQTSYLSTLEDKEHNAAHAVKQALAMQGWQDSDLAPQATGKSSKRVSGSPVACVEWEIGDTVVFKGYNEESVFKYTFGKEYIIEELPQEDVIGPADEDGDVPYPCLNARYIFVWP